MMDKQKINKGVKTVLEWIAYVLFFILIIWGTPRVLVKVLHTDYPIASITSSSMWPVLKEGDVVFIIGVKGRVDIKKGDIVVYSNDRGFTIHRVIKIEENTFTTQGDANTIADSPVLYERLIGKTVNLGDKPIKIPYLGKISQIFKNK